MKPRNSFGLLKFGLAAYRLANMVYKEDGPLDVFFRFRTWVDVQVVNSQNYVKQTVCDLTRYEIIEGKSTKYWKSLRDLLRCPYCLGVWFALVLPLAPGWFVNWLAIAGTQYVIQKAVEK